MEWIHLIIASTISLVCGGGLTIVLTHRYEKLKAKGIAKQALEKGDEVALTNTEKIIKLYKQALNDSQKIWEKEKAQLVTEMDTLKDRVNSQEKLIETQDVKIKEQDKLIKKYIKDQVEMKSELELLKDALTKN